MTPHPGWLPVPRALVVNTLSNRTLVAQEKAPLAGRSGASEERKRKRKKRKMKKMNEAAQAEPSGWLIRTLQRADEEAVHI